MDSTIVAALISAAASIVTAIVGRSTRTAGGTQTHSGATATVPEGNEKAWKIAVTLLLLWTLFAALFLHWDLAGASILLIPVVVLVLALAKPIHPPTAAAATLFLFPIAFAAEPIGKWRRGISFDNHLEGDVLGTFVGIAFVTALLAWGLCRARLRPERTSSTTTTSGSGTLVHDLAELSELHRSGALSDEEFARAKEKLIRS